MDATQTTYTRKVGFFGSIKKLGTTAVSGVNDVTIDVIGVTTNITGSARQISGIARQAVDIWGEDLLEDLNNDREIARAHREIDKIQQQAELTALKAELAKHQAQQA